MNGQILHGTCIAVDFWKIKGRQDELIHFLTHVHGDHIVGLTSSWMRPIYCSDFTAQLLEAHYGVPKCLLKVLPINQTTLLQMPNSTESVCVTPFDANHCPGALMFYFEGSFGNILHTGDFRFSSEMMTQNLARLSGKINKLYFDNTFCSPECVFPAREECLKEIINIVKAHSNFDVLIGVRKLGKESMLAKLGVALDETIFVSSERLNISQCLFDSNVFSVPATGVKSRIRTVPLHSITRDLIHELNQTTPTIAILPTAIFTGLPSKPFSRDPKVFVVPYSDHSSFPELVQFVTELKPKDLIPIVKNSRGPFGADVSNRSNMSCFQLHLDKAEITIKNLQPKTSTSFNNDDLAEQCENENPQEVDPNDNSMKGILTRSCAKPYEVADKQLKKFLSFDITSTPLDRLTSSHSLKRRHTFPDKKKRKVAKGVVFQEENSEEAPGLSPQRNLFQSANVNNVSDFKCLQGDTLDNLLALTEYENETAVDDEEMKGERSSSDRNEYNNSHVTESSNSDCEITCVETLESTKYENVSTKMSEKISNHSLKEIQSSSFTEPILPLNVVRESSESDRKEVTHREELSSEDRQEYTSCDRHSSNKDDLADSDSVETTACSRYTQAMSKLQCSNIGHKNPHGESSVFVFDFGTKIKKLLSGSKPNNDCDVERQRTQVKEFLKRWLNPHLSSPSHSKHFLDAVKKLT